MTAHGYQSNNQRTDLSLADGELSAEEMTIALAGLRSSKDAQQAWEDYHRIGEVLRSEEMDVPLS